MKEPKHLTCRRCGKETDIGRLCDIPRTGERLIFCMDCLMDARLIRKPKEDEPDSVRFEV